MEGEAVMKAAVREMTAEDMEAVTGIEKECFGSQAWSADSFLYAIKDSNALYLAVVCDGCIAGYCGYWQSFEEGEVMNVAVSPYFQNHGLGFMMLQALLERGGEAGIRSFVLEVRIGNRGAVHLYEKLGFVSEGTRKDFYQDPREDAMIMWKR